MLHGGTRVMFPNATLAILERSLKTIQPFAPGSKLIVGTYFFITFLEPKMPKSKEYLSDSDDSSEEEVKMPSKKKQKREREEDKPAKDEKKPVKTTKTDEDIWDLGNNRQVNVRQFKGKYYVDIREMYDKDGELKPGKKGICLSMQQWRKFMEVVEEVDNVAKSKC